MVFCNQILILLNILTRCVTILILIDGFLQFEMHLKSVLGDDSHNPYFNRWFSAIEYKKESETKTGCHNPYFNRWFSAIREQQQLNYIRDKSQSLF